MAAHSSIPAERFRVIYFKWDRGCSGALLPCLATWIKAQSRKEFFYRLGFFSREKRQSKRGQERKRKDTERESLS